MSDISSAGNNVVVKIPTRCETMLQVWSDWRYGPSRMLRAS